MPIEKLGVDLSAYTEVTICSPIWVFSLSAPMRTFVKAAKGKIKNVNYVFVHYTNGRYAFVADETDKMLGVKRNKLINVRSRQGKFKYYEQ